jgi:hypothetical protein
VLEESDDDLDGRGEAHPHAGGQERRRCSPHFGQDVVELAELGLLSVVGLALDLVELVLEEGHAALHDDVLEQLGAPRLLLQVLHELPQPVGPAHMTAHSAHARTQHKMQHKEDKQQFSFLITGSSLS